MYDVIPVTSPKPLDCGPTCLKMLLSYYGTDVPLEALAEECGLTLAGCTATDLMRVGRAHGLDMQCFSMDADELARQDRPAIVHWRNNHWVVFAGTEDDGRVWVCNPDRGRFRMDPETFAALATGLDSYPGQVIAIFNGDPVDLLPVATDNHAEGELFEMGGATWRALAAIARGERIVEGVNAERVSVAEVLTDLEARGQE